MYFDYIKLGIEHILDLNGLDHILFLIVLTLPFVIKEWKSVIILATAFTIGHSLTLILSGLDFIRVQSEPIEMGIAITILLTGLYNIFNTLKSSFSKTRYWVALLFGLIHGLGFSNYLKPLFSDDSIVLPLLCFNVGIEIAQLIVVLIILLINYIVLEKLKLEKKYWIISISLFIMIWAIKLIIER